MSLLAIAAAVGAFNLRCTGEVVTREGAMLVAPVTARSSFERIYRIDLAARRWCEGPCRTTEHIAGVTDTEIVLEYEDHGDAASGLISDFEAVLNRETGELQRRVRLGSAESLFVQYERGPCVREPFSGFPEKAF